MKANAGSAQPKAGTGAAKGSHARVWTVGEGELLAEELYRYNDSSAHNVKPILAASGGEFEQVNLLAGAKAGVVGLGARRPSPTTVRQIKDQLMTALLARKPLAEVRGIKIEM